MIPYDDDDGQLLGTSGSSGAFSSPFFFFYMSNLNRLHYHPFLLKIVTNQSLCFFVFFSCYNSEILISRRGVQIERFKSPFIMVHSKLNDCIFGDESSDQS